MANNRDPKVLEAELEAVGKLIRHHQIALAVARAQRDELVWQSDGVLSRRAVAKLAGMTPGRVQQIIGRDD